ERKPPPDPDTPLAFSMEGYYGTRTPPALLPYSWAPGWNSNQQSVQKFKDETGRARGGAPGVRLFAPREEADRHPPREDAPRADLSREDAPAAGAPRESAPDAPDAPHAEVPRRDAPRENASGEGASPRGDSASSADRRSSEPLSIVVLHHVFGSEELSALSAPIAERVPKPYVALS